MPIVGDLEDEDSATAGPSARELLTACPLTFLRLLSYASKRNNAADKMVGRCVGTGGGEASKHRSRKSHRRRTESIDDDASIDTTCDGLSDDEHRHGRDDRDCSGKDHADVSASFRSDSSGQLSIISKRVIEIAGSCLSRIAMEIDLASAPRGAMESVLCLLHPTVHTLVREQAALVLGATAGQGHDVIAAKDAGLFALLRSSRNTGDTSGGAGGYGEGNVTVPLSESPLSDEEEEGEGVEARRTRLWRRFCAGMVGGKGAQVGSGWEMVEGRLSQTNSARGNIPNVARNEVTALSTLVSHNWQRLNVATVNCGVLSFSYGWRCLRRPVR